MDAKYRSHARRSHPNLQLLSVKPLTPNYPLPLTVDTSADSHHAPRNQNLSATPKSYIAPRSVPQTPSILSRSSSRTRLRPSSRSSSRGNLVLNGPDEEDGINQLRQRGHGQINPNLHHRSQSSKIPRSGSESANWLVQTASTLTMSAAESKGQAWLATRSSSTSLADTPFELPLDREYRADDEFSPVSVRYSNSRSQSKFPSRGTSRATSRRGSRVGLMTPMGLRTPGERESDGEGYFDGIGVDFVEDGEDDDEEAIGDEGEVRRLVWGRATGWVDWAVGWMDFRNEDGIEEQADGEEKDEANDENAVEGSNKKSVSKRRRMKQRADLHYERTKDIGAVPPAPKNEGVLGDAAWLLGVAKSSIP